MELQNISTEDLLKEIESRKQVVVTGDLVVGSIGNDGGRLFVEVFNKISNPEDLSFLDTYKLRMRFNPHRKYKLFYFKTNQFEKLNKMCDESNEELATFICFNDSIKYFI